MARSIPENTDPCRTIRLTTQIYIFESAGKLARPLPVEGVGRLLEDALTGNGVLPKLTTYEARLLRQSQQLLGQFFALRKARAADLSVLNGDDEANDTSEMLSPRQSPGGEGPPEGQHH